MPLPPPARALPWPRRRTLLASAAGAVLLAGCSDGSGDSGDRGGLSVSERARARAARDSRRLVDRYDAVITVHPALADRLGPLRAEAAAHAEAFEDGSASPSRSSSASSASSAPSRSAEASAAPAVPADAKDALAALAAAERALADRRATALLHVEGELARLLASVAAAGAAHAYLLTKGDK
ncbi:hypothetical protein ABZ915_46390 [Streptomyces sp. NPDC046915]|uniref:hypothetical protein n=1 Tax=Streptomyces sp. NPDC046915 TaxID=3155257 RepID=UPI0033D8F988